MFVYGALVSSLCSCARRSISEACVDSSNPSFSTIGIFTQLLWSRFKLNVSAGSQKRTIHKPEGRNESRFSLMSKK
jgi:hypothetical protein